MDKPKITAKDFFMHVAILVTLYTSVISVITLLVQTINAALPDALDGMNYAYQGYTSGMRFAVASLIIIFPVFILLSWWNHRQIARNPELKDLSIRKWFSYLTLFLSGATIITDLIVFLNSFLGGEISARFIWKALAVLLVAAFVFIYHIIEVRKMTVTRATYRIFSGVAILVVLASIVWSFVVMGSPTTQRDLRFDQTRTNDLQNIQWQVINYWQSKGKLPLALTDMEDSISGWKAPVDPLTKGAYEYRITDSMKFELCATFSLPSAATDGRSKVPMPYTTMEGGYNPQNDNWAHPAGNACFNRTIDPQLYPINPKVPPVPVR